MTDRGFGFGTPFIDTTPICDDLPSSSTAVRSRTATAPPPPDPAAYTDHTLSLPTSTIRNDKLPSPTTISLREVEMADSPSSSSSHLNPYCDRSSASPMALDHHHLHDLDSSSSESPTAISSHHLHAQFFRYRRHQSTPSPFSVKLHNSPASGAASDSDGGGGSGVGAEDCLGGDTTCLNSVVEGGGGEGGGVGGGVGDNCKGCDLNTCLRQKLVASDDNIIDSSSFPSSSSSSSMSTKEGEEVDAKNRDGKKSV